MLILLAVSSMFLISASVSVTEAAARFSQRRSGLRVPGMGDDIAGRAGYRGAGAGDGAGFLA